MDYETAVEKLKLEYKEIFKKENGQPTWAYHKKSSPKQLIMPTIPFVGKNYFEQQKKVLLYASAENLSYYKKPEDYLDDDDKAINRHRLFFDNSFINDEHVFYPDVHIAPIDDGRLAVAAYYLLRKQYDFPQCTPKELYEKICFANYGKFSAETNSNKDYASKKQKLSASTDYILRDLKILKPDIIIMVKSMLNIGNQRDVLKSSGLKFDIFPIYQITPLNINKYIKNYSKENYKHLDDNIKLWFTSIKNNGRGSVVGKTKENYESLFSYLDSIEVEHIF